MAAPRRVTIKDLSACNVNPNIEILSRHEDSHFVNAKCTTCMLEFPVRITGIRKGSFTECPCCKDEKFVQQAKDKGLILLCHTDKKRYNECDWRWYIIEKCGHMKEMTLNHVRSQEGDVYCEECDILDIREAAGNSNFDLLHRAERSHVKLKCRDCLHESSYQYSNIKYNRRVKCRNCSQRKKADKSYVYLFRITVPDSSCFLKLGKSNNPFLRQISFLKEDGAEKEFLGSCEFPSEDDALSFEKGLFRLFKVHRLDSSKVRDIMYTGFTECLDVSCEQEILEIFKTKGK